MDSEPPPPKQISARKRARISESPRRIRANRMGVPSARPFLGFEETAKFYSGVFIVPSPNLFSKQNTLAFPARWSASVRSTELLLKQKCGRTLCTPPQLIWGMEAVCRNADSVLRKLFSGDLDFRKTETNFSKKDFWIWFPPRRRGLGRNAGRILF